MYGSLIKRKADNEARGRGDAIVKMTKGEEDIFVGYLPQR